MFDPGWVYWTFLDKVDTLLLKNETSKNITIVYLSPQMLKWDWTLEQAFWI